MTGAREPGADNDGRDSVARRRKANVRLAVVLALLAAAIYFGFILSYL